MDVQMRCWDSAQRSEMRYCTSIFWGHSTANDIQEKLLSALQPLPCEGTSMDGPNVDVKFSKKGLQEHLQQNCQVQCVDLCTCRLHTVRNAVHRAGASATLP